MEKVVVTAVLSLSFIQLCFKKITFYSEEKECKKVF